MGCTDGYCFQDIPTAITDTQGFIIIIVLGLVVLAIFGWGWYKERK